MSVQPPLVAGKTKYPPQRRTRPVGPPPLTAGDRLTRAEFERIYQAHPEVKRAELVEGVVYMPSPVHFARSMANLIAISWHGWGFTAPPRLVSWWATTPPFASTSRTSYSRMPCYASTRSWAVARACQQGRLPGGSAGARCRDRGQQRRLRSARQAPRLRPERRAGVSGSADVRAEGGLVCPARGSLRDAEA